MHHFKYLGPSMEETGGMATQITHIVCAAWETGRDAVVCGVLCDRTMPVKLKGKDNKNVVRPALLYGAETWETTSREDEKQDQK